MSLSPADQAALDALYNLRAAVPEHPAWFERYAATSAAFRARWPGRLDLPYGDSARQAIDLFLRETLAIEGLPIAAVDEYVTVGERETPAFHRQSRAYADALGRHGVPCELVTQPGLDHFSIIMAIAFLLDGIDDPTIVWPYAEENDNSLYSRNYKAQDLSFMTKRGHGRHYMAWTEAYLASNPETTLARRLRQALAEFGHGEPPMIDEYSGGNMSRFFRVSNEKDNQY